MHKQKTSTHQNPLGIHTSLCAALHREFHFDVLARGADKTHRSTLPGALNLNWFDNSEKKAILFIPPSKEAIGKWLAKAIYESRKGATVIGLIPVCLEKDYFHKYIQNIASEVRFIKTPKTLRKKYPCTSKTMALVVFKSFKGTTKFTSANYNAEIISFLN